MLAVQGNEIQVELSVLVLLVVLECDLQMSAILICLKDDAVFVRGQLEHLVEVCNRYTEGHRTIGSVALEPLLAQRQRNKRNM